MDLKCKVDARRGKIHWAAGYQILIGRDGIARNVPAEAATEMLTNREVWEPVSNAPPPDLRGIPLKTHSLGVQEMHSISAQRVVEVPLVPRSLAYLERCGPEAQAALCAIFDVEPPEAQEAEALVARRILASADDQLLAQLREMIEGPAVAKVPVEETTSVPAPPAPAPRAEPKGKKGKKAAKSGQPAEDELAPVSTIED